MNETTPPAASDLDDVAWADHLLDLLEAARANSDSDEVAEFAAGFELIQAIGKMRAAARAEGWDDAVKVLKDSPARYFRLAAEWLEQHEPAREGE